MKTILLADSHTIVRAGVRKILDAVPDFTVVAETSESDETVAKVREHQPDCVLIDCALPEMGGLEATRRLIRLPSPPKIVGFGAQADGPVPVHMMSAGAIGYLSKSCEPRDVVFAIRSVIHGQRYIEGNVARALLEQGMDGRRTPIDDLSRRELEVLTMVSHAHTQDDIARRLCVSPKTVSTYRTRICRKLDVKSDVQLVHIALRYGLLNI